MGRSGQTKTDLIWWIQQAPGHNDRPLHSPQPDLIIQSDASLQGWGAVSGQEIAQGRWSIKEKALHINVLELKAALLAIQSFVQNHRDLVIELQLDNTSAVAYLNHQGGVKFQALCILALQVWQYCETQNISFSVGHLPGIANLLADYQSRTFLDNHDYQLLKPCGVQTDLPQVLPARNRPVCQSQFNSTASVRFVENGSSSNSYQCFLHFLGREKALHVPTSHLILRCLKQVIRDKARTLFIAPVWKTSPWYPLLLQLSCQNPVLLPAQRNLLIEPHTGKPPKFNLTPLAMWQLSGHCIENRDFRSRLQTFPLVQCVPEHPSCMTASGIDWLAGVYDGIQIHFHALWRKLSNFLQNCSQYTSWHTVQLMVTDSSETGRLILQAARETANSAHNSASS
ncbi:uncharacterized protein LOC144438146 [Glandiceps talaboti]